MKILVFAYDLVLSGVSVNVIELSAALRDNHGHDVVVFAGPGPMAALAEEKRLRLITAPAAHSRVHPSPTRMRALRDVARQEQPDLIHAWDWVQCLDAYYGEHLFRRLPMVVTDMSMHVPRLLPRALPTTFGTPELVDLARAQKRRRVELLLPPVDTRDNAPGAVDPAPFRERHGLGPDTTVLVTVSRLDSDMKAESLSRSLDAVQRLGRSLPVQLVIVGDGDLRQDLERRADRINSELGRRAVIMTGPLVDPRPAYAAADVVIGMGGSALRGMAFGKPVVVVGVNGFSMPFTPETAEHFLYKGMFGIGAPGADNTGHEADIRTLAERPERLPELGEFAREFVIKHFDLDVVAGTLSNICEATAARRPRRGVAAVDGLRTAAVWLRERRFVPYGRSLGEWLARRSSPS